MQFAAYVGVKYSTLASWIQKRERGGQQEKSLIRAESGVHSDKGNGTWVEAVIERGPEPKAPQGSLLIYFSSSHAWLEAIAPDPSSRLKICAPSSGVNVIEISYDIYAFSNSGAWRDAYVASPSA